MRLRILLAAAAACLTMAAIAVPASAAPRAAVPPMHTIDVSGVGKNGKKFEGTYAIQRFVVKGDAVYSVGKLTGRLKNRRVSRNGVMMPATLQRAAGARAAQAGTCEVLELVLGPIDLNLLGLRVELGGGLSANQPIVLRITAIQGGGLLGDLLCGLTNLLNQDGILEQLVGNLNDLAATLNSLVSLLDGLQAARR